MKVILRTINHALLTMTSMTLADFRVGDAEPLREGGDLSTARVTPVQNMKILKFVADDEATQHKAFNFMFDNKVGLSLRGFGDSETSHPAWNSFKKAINKAGFTITMMKLTLCSNLL